MAGIVRQDIGIIDCYQLCAFNLQLNLAVVVWADIAFSVGNGS